MTKSPPVLHRPSLRRRSRVWSAAPAVLTCVYWLTALGWGLYRLRRDGTGAALPIVQGWYVAGLVFLGVWGAGALLAGIFTPSRRQPRGRSDFAGNAPILSPRRGR